MVNQRVTRL